MKLQEGYEAALRAIWTIAESGIAVRIKSSRSASDPQMVAKYKKNPKGLERLPASLWVNVNFQPRDPAGSRRVFEETQRLRSAGVGFDTGGGEGGRDWELDWSFTASPTADAESLAALEWLEGVLPRFQKEPGPS